jgi:hypothetical protein
MPESKADDDVAEHHDENDACVVVYDIRMVTQIQDENDTSTGENYEKIDGEINKSGEDAPAHYKKTYYHGRGDNSQSDLPGRQINIGEHFSVRDKEEIVDKDGYDSHNEKTIFAGIEGIGEKVLLELTGEEKEWESGFHGFLDIRFQPEDVITVFVFCQSIGDSQTSVASVLEI